MHKNKTIFLIIFFLFSFHNYTFAENKIAYVDLDYILSNTNIGKRILDDLKKKENSKIEEFKIEEKNLKNEENKILASKNIISKDEFNNNVEKFKKKLEAYKLLKNNEINELKEKRNQEVSKLINSVNSVIENYMSKNSISIILDKKNVYIADKNYDITSNIIELINKSIK